MTSPIKKSGTPLSSIFDLWQAGTDKAPATGIKENGVDTSDIYAMLKYGTAAAPTGVKSRNADLNTIYAAKGTASYTLGFHGGNYSSTRVRAEASITLRFNANGTWQVIRDFVENGSAGTVIASGSWLPSGASASEYSVQFSTAGLTNGPDSGGGTDIVTNQAATAKTLTGTYYVKGAAVTVVVGNTFAENNGSFSAVLRRNGSVVSTSTCSVNCYSTGSG